MSTMRVRCNGDYTHFHEIQCVLALGVLLVQTSAHLRQPIPDKNVAADRSKNPNANFRDNQSVQGVNGK